MSWIQRGNCLRGQHNSLQTVRMRIQFPALEVLTFTTYSVAKNRKMSWIQRENSSRGQHKSLQTVRMRIQFPALEVLMFTTYSVAKNRKMSWIQRGNCSRGQHKSLQTVRMLIQFLELPQCDLILSTFVKKRILVGYEKRRGFLEDHRHILNWWMFRSLINAIEMLCSLS